MPAVDASVILRLGSHSEKDYFEKVIRFIDGYIIAANLVESTPAACASLVFRFSGDKKSTPYFLDPMTYAFGAYMDPETGKVRNDLDWIKSDQKLKTGKKGEKETVRAFKRSYRNLGEKFGGPFAEAVRDPNNKNAAISPEDLKDEGVIDQVASAVVRYQLERIRKTFSEEIEEDFGVTHDLPLPQAVMAPYFYIEPSAQAAWLDVNLRLMRATVALGNKGLPAHGVLCMDQGVLCKKKDIIDIADKVVGTGVDGVWLWFSKLNEDELIAARHEHVSPKDVKSYIRSTSTFKKLSALRELVERLSEKVEVYNMHGGFFSLALSKFGMKGISHGVGYGERKDVVPIVGQAIPMVRYYLPDIYRRLGIPDIESCFNSLSINQPNDFYDQICDCAICRGVVNSDVEQFRLFGELQPRKPGKKRSTQTPDAAKRCRFHFLLTRIRERDWIKNVTVQEIAESLTEADKQWSEQRTVKRYCSHLKAWKEALIE